MKVKGLHSGHRQRLKDKVRKYGLAALSNHEVLELMLTYTIPYKDTNELAHQLLNKYGTIKNVMRAPENELLTFCGVGKETSLFMSVLIQFYEMYFKDLSDNKCKIATSDQCVKYFRENFSIGEKEATYLCFTDKNHNLIRFIKVSEGSSFDVKMDRTELGQVIGMVNAPNIVLVHTHPTNSPKPSDADYSATSIVMSACLVLGKNFKDHIIISPSEYYYFRNNDKIFEKIELEITEKVNQLSEKEEKKKQ